MSQIQRTPTWEEIWNENVVKLTRTHLILSLLVIGNALNGLMNVQGNGTMKSMLFATWRYFFSFFRLSKPSCASSLFVAICCIGSATAKNAIWILRLL